MRIAIIKLSALGDIIHSMVVLQYIKKEYPNSYIEWIVESAFAPILENNPHIDHITKLDLKKFKKEKSLKLLLQQIKIVKNLEKFDIVIDMQGLIKSAIVTKLINADEKWGFDKFSIREKIASFFYNREVHIAYSENVIKRNIHLVKNGLNLDIDMDNIDTKESFLYSKHSYIDSGYILFIVGASTKNKMYPKERFLKLSSMFDLPIYAIWGNETEENIANFLQENSNIKKAPKMSLDELKAFIKNARLVIGADTGPTHMAWAMNVASITIFGNTPEYRNTMTTTINKTIKSNSKVNPLKLDKSDFSINEIDEKDIYNIAKGLL